MYRSNLRGGYSSYTQTVTQPQTNTTSSTPNLTTNMFSRTGTILGTNSGSASASASHGTASQSDEIIFAIVTGNLREVTRLVNSTNINNVIDNKNRYTALHYAVKLPNNDIVEYLMNCGADPNIKQNEGKDSIDLSIEANKRFLINKVMAKNERELDDVYNKLDESKHTMRTLERKNKELTEANTYLEKVNGEFGKKIEELKEENKSVKRKLDDSEKAFENLLKKNRK